jgi:exodeoxyribonuclease VII large subunit
MSPREAYSVSGITALIKTRLEESFGEIVVEGEISNFRPSSSGHVYFALKDSGALLNAVMFRSRARELSFDARDGVLARARGRIEVYAQRGSYQLICDSLEPAGMGAILAMLEERKRRLAAEGLFDEARKRPLPEIPGKVALVTSPTGAAIRDMLSVFARRAPWIGLVVLPCPVQGEGAGEAIAAQIRRAGRYGLAELIIVGRGGGSIEDLLPFSEECVVRAIAESPLPVISAVGHEIDWALSDFAADLRAPTPSAAAEIASEGAVRVAARVGTARDSILAATRQMLERLKHALELSRPDSLEMLFRRSFQPFLLRFDDAKEDILKSMAGRCEQARERLAIAHATIEGASPELVFARGFSLVLDPAGRPVRDASVLAIGYRLSLRFAKGGAEAAVESIELERSLP